MLEELQLASSKQIQFIGFQLEVRVLLDGHFGEISRADVLNLKQFNQNIRIPHNSIFLKTFFWMNLLK
jgi:hypothetical protein